MQPHYTRPVQKYLLQCFTGWTNRHWHICLALTALFSLESQQAWRLLYSKVYLLTECGSFECDILLVLALNDEAWNWQGTESYSTCSNVPVMKAIAASWINCQCGTLPPAGSCVTAAEESLLRCSPAASAWTATLPTQPKFHHHETDRETSAAAPWKDHKKTISVSKNQFWGNGTRKSTEKMDFQHLLAN